MAIVTPQFVISAVTHDLPHASEYRHEVDYTSVPLKMANGYTVWQNFVVEGDDEDSHPWHRVMVSWNKLTIGEKNILAGVFASLRSNVRGTFRAPDSAVFAVTIDPDHPKWEFESFSVNLAGTMTLYYRTTIHLLQDTVDPL
jgi:hypothetical protein